MRTSNDGCVACALVVALILMGSLAGCGDSAPGDADAGGQGASAASMVGMERPVASDFDVGEVLTPAEYLDEPRYREANLRRGEVLALACRACHTFGAGQAHQLGPNLHGIFGRESGTLDGFEYSDALRQAAIVWTPRAIEAWLQNPSGFIPGNTMVFAGLRADVDRRDLLAYLLRATLE